MEREPSRLLIDMLELFRPLFRQRADSLPAIALVIITVVFAACGNVSNVEVEERSGPVVVSTTAPLVDLVQKVAGQRAVVRALVPSGENGHTYQPRPSDARVLTQADLFIDNGLSLNVALQKFAVTNLPSTAQVIFVGERAIPEEELIGAPKGCHQGHCHGSANAHLMPDVRYAADYVEVITQALVSVDGPGAEVYRANARSLRSLLARLDSAIATATATIPEANRKLVVYHDAWPYFARRYGLRVVGAIQLATFAEPSAGKVRAMIEQINRARVPAFFGSEVFPSDVLAAIEEATGARHVADLSDDELPGEVGGPMHSYAGMMFVNTRLLVETLGGDVSALEAFSGQLS
jgi:ABC-type Zn uptake system ZnuABC Zn-binding protein ZnuA